MLKYMDEVEARVEALDSTTRVFFFFLSLPSVKSRVSSGIVGEVDWI